MANDTLIPMVASAPGASAPAPLWTHDGLRAAEALHVAAVAFIDDDSDEMFEALEQATQAFSIAVGAAS